MKIYSKILALSACMALCMNITSCGGSDNEPVGPDPLPSAIKIKEVSVAEGAQIDPSLTQISVVYSVPVMLNNSTPVTLNGTAISATVKDDSILVASVMLSPESTYVFTIPEKAVTGRTTPGFGPALTLHFTTSALAEADYLPLLNPAATKEAQNVYKFLIEQNGKKIISGAMANVNNNSDFSGWIKKVTGKNVAFECYDFIHLPESGQNWIDYSDISPAKNHWAANGLVGYMWHWRVPYDKAAYDKKDYNRYDAKIKGENGGSGTEFDIREALKEGTWQHEFILADIDKVAGYLKLLQAENIPVIWRPLHEAAGSYKYGSAWFWWGRYGAEPTKELWKLMYDRLVNHHGLNNLIWVWTVQTEPEYFAQMQESYPGNDWCDVVGVDVYASDDSSQKNLYDCLVKLTGGKRLITLSETGRIQNPDKCISEGAYWSWFNLWYTYDQHKSDSDTDGFGNTTASLKAVFDSPYVINRNDMPSLK